MRPWIGLAGAVALLALLHSPFGPTTPFWQKAFDVGHVVVFGVLALIALSLVRRRLPPQRPWLPYGVTLVLTVAMGLASEGLQYFGPRNADLLDALRNAAGATSFLLLAVTTDPAVSERLPRRSLRLVAALLLAAAALPLAWYGYAQFQRRQALPVLFAFDARWERQFVRVIDAELETVAAPWRPGGPTTTRLTFHPARFPGLRLRPYPDWRGYAAVALDLHSPLAVPMRLRIRIDDATHDGDIRDRYTHVFDVLPGANRLLIPLDEVRRAPRGRRMDLGAIRRMALFDVDTRESFSLYLDDIRLLSTEAVQNPAGRTGSDLVESPSFSRGSS